MSERQPTHSMDRLQAWRPAMPYVLHLGLWLMFFGLVWVGLNWLGSSQHWPIQHVRIEGELHHVDRDSMAKRLEQQLQRGFFAMNNQAVVREAESLPWIRSARVHKVWPDTLVLAVEEQVAVAHWNESNLLGEYGDRFSPEKQENLPAMPQLFGPNGHEREVLQAYADMLEPLAEMGLSVTSLGKSDHGAWQVQFEQGLKMQIGQQAPVKRVLQTLAQLKQLGDERFQQIRQIDMRYPNGVAIAWKKGYTPDWIQKDGKSVAWVLARNEQG